MSPRKATIVALLVILGFATSAFSQSLIQPTVGLSISSIEKATMKATIAAMLIGKLASSRHDFRLVRLENPEKLSDASPADIQAVLKSTKTYMLVVGTMEASYSPTELAGEKLTTCRLVFTYVIYDVRGEVVSGNAVDASGAGFSSASALAVAVDHMVFMLRTTDSALALASK